MKRADTLRALERAAMAFYRSRDKPIDEYDAHLSLRLRDTLLTVCARHAARLKAKRRGRKS